jgi:hypothetical protein
MADVPGTLAGLGTLLIAVLGTVGPAVAAAPIVTAPAPVVARVGSATTLAGASIAGSGDGPLRLVVTVSSGVLELPGTTADVVAPAGYPAPGISGAQLAIEGEETAVNAALGELAWVPAAAGPAELTLEVGPAGAAYEAEGAHFYQLVTSPTPLTWDAARAAAESTSLAGLPASLAAVTTDAEYALVARVAPVDAWVGAAALGAPDGVRWLDGPEPAATISAYIVEYADPLVEGASLVTRATATLRAAVPPAAPTIVEVTAGAGEATVRWTPPAADGGAPVLGYVVAGDPGGWCAVGSAETSCVLRGLVGGAAHTFAVAAINEVGLGAWSPSSASVTPGAPPSTTPPSTTAPPSTTTTPSTAGVPAPVTGGPPDTVDTTVRPLPTAAPGAAPAGDAVAPSNTPAGGASVSPGAEATPVAGTVPPVQDAATGRTAAPAADTGAAVTPAAGTDPPGPSVPTSAADAAADATAVADGSAVADAGDPSLTAVFSVGPGASVADARFTVRGAHLSPGSVVTVVAHSEPVVLGTAEVGADGTVTWSGTLPPGLADGEHTLVAGGVGHDGSSVERTIAFTAAAGRLVRIGASSVETIAPTLTTTAAAPPVDAATPVIDAAAGASSGGLPRRAVALVLVLGAAAVLWWRSRSRRASSAATAVSEQPAAGERASTASPTRAPRPGASRGSATEARRAPSGARRRSRRAGARSV